MFITGRNEAQRDQVSHVPRISDFRASSRLMGKPDSTQCVIQGEGGSACARMEGSVGVGGAGKGETTETSALVPSCGHSHNPRNAKIGCRACVMKPEWIKQKREAKLESS